MPINRNKSRNNRVNGISRQGYYKFILNMLHMLKKIRGKHKHDEERNRRYKKRTKFIFQRSKIQYSAKEISQDWINSRLDTVEEEVSEYEDILGWGKINCGLTD